MYKPGSNQEQGSISLSLKRDTSKYVTPQSRPKPFEEEFPTLINAQTKRQSSAMNFSKVVTDKIEKDSIEDEKKVALENSETKRNQFDSDGIYIPNFKKLYEARALRQKEQDKLQPLFTSSSEDEEDIVEDNMSDSFDEDAEEGNDIEETYDSFEFNRHR